MRMHLEAIDIDLWYVIKTGIPKVDEGVTAADVKRFAQLDLTAKNIICGHLTKGQYGHVSSLETAKLVWDWLSKDQHMDKVMLVESLGFNLMSVSMLCDLNMIVIFDKYRCLVLMESDKSLVFKGYRRG